MRQNNGGYNLQEDNRFVIENYGAQSPFASFLPGIAGLKGIPMWAFYVNRGQGICSFGIRDKDKSIMEFYPAHKAFQQVELTGFRTFINLMDEAGNKYYEPFSTFVPGEKAKTKLLMGANELSLEEESQQYGLKTTVEYFTLPEEELAALVRKVTLQNISDKKLSLEVLDGIPALLPYGIDHEGNKNIGNTLKAWMEVYNLEKKLPFYKLRAGTEDKADVEAIAEGYFYMGFGGKEKEELLQPIVDPVLVFGSNTAMTYPEGFLERGLAGVQSAPQIASNKVPCGFAGIAATLEAGQQLELYFLIGYVSGAEKLNAMAERLVCKEYIGEKQRRARTLVRELTEEIFTRTSSRLFDEYCRQSYLDNLLRGGYPVLLAGKEKDRIYYVYSRKHGDLERDYNFFVTEPEFYSSGNGNYRDVNQNRCNDVFFHPEVGHADIMTFMNLIQADGYNPLVIMGGQLTLEEAVIPGLLGLVEAGSRTRLERLFSKPFTLGKLYKTVLDEVINVQLDKQDFVDLIIEKSELQTDAVHQEGYWTDHWVYNLDLIEKYLKIYPDKKKELLLCNKDYTYYDNAAVVNPRSHKYQQKEQRILQLDAVSIDQEKEKLIAERNQLPYIMRNKNGRGEIYKSSLLAKLVVLAVNKFSCLDPKGTGVEMEAGKPGWNDALNGLPGLFGSSVAESCELLRLLDLISEVCEEYGGEELSLPLEVWQLLESLLSTIEDFGSFGDWDSRAAAREAYRESIRLGFEGAERTVSLADLSTPVHTLHEKLAASIEKARVGHQGIYPTYYYYEPVGAVTAFEQHSMPLFLEGVVKGLKICKDELQVKALYGRVKSSSLFDEKLHMYKVCQPLAELGIDFGRITAFTPGWFENETVWLHMEYKYMLELLNCGLYEEFFSDFEKVLIPFLEPRQYGRSTLENSSFIASSANPDPAIHGKGFVARLSGATAEFLSIWNTMMAGHQPYRLAEGRLQLELKPILPHWLFDEKDEVEFRFMGKTKVTYYNPSRRNTYEKDMSIGLIKIWDSQGNEITLEGQGFLPEPYAIAVRYGKIEKIYIEYL